jgi:histidinol-phosphate aminotransferase
MFRRDPLDREIFGLAVPAIGALAADPLLSLVDTALVGNLGAVPLAALGINLAVFTTVFITFNFLVYGTTAEVAQQRGRGDDRAAARYAVQALWLAGGLGVTMIVVLQLAAPAIVELMGATGDVRDPALAYLRIRAFAAVSVFTVMVGHGTFRGLKDTRTPLVVAVVANVANAALSYVLIYPLALGVRGAAIGTLVAQTGSAIAFLALGSRALPVVDRRFDRTAMSSIVRISRDLFLRTLALLSGLLVTTAVAARMGLFVVAGHQVVREVWSLLVLTLDGFAIAAQAMVGTSLGAGRIEEARRTSMRLLWWGGVVGAGLGVVVWFAGPLVAPVFTNDAAVLEQIDQVWWLVALAQPAAGIVFAADGILMGAKDFRFLLVTTAFAALGALVPLALASLWAGWGIVGLWISMVTLVLVRLVAVLWRLHASNFDRAVRSVVPQPSAGTCPDRPDPTTGRPTVTDPHLARASRLDRDVPYVAGPTRAAAAAALGVEEVDVVKLSSNENPVGPSPAAVAAVLRLAEELHEYPASDPAELRAAIGHRFEVSPDHVATSAGSSTLMYALVAAFGSPGGLLVRSVPGFDVYEQLARTHALSCVDVPLVGDGFVFDLPGVLARIGPRTQFVFVTRPNNPTSTMATLDQLRAVCETAAGVGAIVVSDEAYHEFADTSDPRRASGTALLAEGHDNLVVTRTLSKAYGLGGLRLGYSLSTATIARILRAASPPWPTSSLTQAAALAALDDEVHLARTVRTVQEQRARLLDALPRLGLPVVPDPQGNYVMVDVRATGRDAPELTTTLATEAGVLIRGDFSGTHVRISVGTADHNDRLLAGLASVLGRTQPADALAPPHSDR